MTLHGIAFSQPEIAEYCRANRIRRLALFGSILRDDFGADSDIDVLVEFEPQARVGLRLHQPTTNPRWGVEYTARMVATQNLFASYLGEQRTGGFVVHYLRAYWQPRDNIQVLAGVENIGNLQYREHLDLRTGFGVFQPGINVYTGVRVSY